MTCHSDRHMSFRDMLEATSEEYMLRQLAEECAELAQACLKVVRVKHGETPMTEPRAHANLQEEMADVKLMLDAVSDSVLNEFDAGMIGNLYAAKLRRMSDRLKLRIDSKA